MRRPILGTTFAIGLVSVLGSAGGHPPTVEARLAAGGSFDLVESGVTLERTVHEVLCTRQAGWADLWIRLAGPPAPARGLSFYLDFDVCNADGGGTFTGMDPRGAQCSEAKTWDVWWHAEDGTVFVNDASDDCVLTLEEGTSPLQGTFECQGLEADGTGRELDLRNGSFTCTEGPEFTLDGPVSALPRG